MDGERKGDLFFTELKPKKRDSPRSIFIRYSRTARLDLARNLLRGTLRTDNIEAWNGLSAQNKARFFEWYSHVYEARKKAKTQGAVAGEEERRLDRHIEAGEWPHVPDAWDFAVEQQSKHVTDLHKLAISTRRLRAFFIVTRHHRHVIDFTAGIWQEDDEAETNARQHLHDLETYDLGLPPRADGVLKVAANWVSHEGDRKRAVEKKRGLRNRPIPLPRGHEDNHWIGPWIVAGGGHGDTGIWVEVDEAGRIQDRIVRKETYVSMHSWGNMARWDNPQLNSTVRDGLTRRPMEVARHEDLFAIKGDWGGQSVGVPYLRTYEVDNENLKWTMYLDYCVFGDLNDLIVSHYKHNTDHPDWPISLPEPFLWRTLLSLAVAGVAMEKGYLNDPDPDKAVWQEIVHRDLKPGNVFLDAPTPDHFASYPTPKLGDFGVAIKTSQDDVLNPTIFSTQGGTRGFEAPEQAPFVDADSGEPVDRFKQLSHTNVYGIGIIMFCLATLVHAPEERWWLGEGEGDEPNIRDAAYENMTGHYSDLLKDTIQGCLRFKPELRLTFAQIMERIHTAVEIDNLTHGRKEAGHIDDDGRWVEDDAGDWDPEDDDLRISKKVYANKTLLEDLPNREENQEGNRERGNEEG